MSLGGVSESFPRVLGRRGHGQVAQMGGPEPPHRLPPTVPLSDVHCPPAVLSLFPTSCLPPPLQGQSQTRIFSASLLPFQVLPGRFGQHGPHSPWSPQVPSTATGSVLMRLGSEFQRGDTEQYGHCRGLRERDGLLHPCLKPRGSLY